MNMLKEQQHSFSHFSSLKECLPRTSSLSASLTPYVHEAHGQSLPARTKESWDKRSAKLLAIGKTAVMTAHDLNNLLTVIQGSIELAELASPAPTRQKHLQNAINGIHRGAQLLEQLLIGSNEEDYSHQLLSMSSLVDETIELLSATLSPSITIEKIDRSRSSLIRGNATQIYQLISNLIVNAVKVMTTQKSGIITVRIEEVEEKYSDGTQSVVSPYLRLSVCDSGPGISHEIRDRIFDPFFFGSGHHAGTGLGLTIANDIVKKHEGCIAVESQLGEGSTFHVYLPIVRDSKDDGPNTTH